MKERAIDVIKLTAVPGHAIASQSGATIMNGIEYIHHVFINGKLIWSDGVYFSEFEAMLNAPGDYWPFTCSFCGEPGCVGIFSPVRCYHKGDLLILVIRKALQDECYLCEDSNCKIKWSDCPKRHPVYHAYCIKKEQLRQQLDDLHKEFGKHLGRGVGM